MDTKTLCLAVLSRGPASGYEIKKTLEQPPYCLFQDTGFGSIYPALQRLSEEGAVAATDCTPTGRPAKRIHALTDEGRSRLLEALSQAPTPDRLRSDFLFTLLHGDLLPPELVLEMVDARIADLETRLAQVEACEPDSESPCAVFLHDLGRAHYGGCLDYLRRNRPKLAQDLAAAATRDARRAAE